MKNQVANTILKTKTDIQERKLPKKLIEKIKKIELRKEKIKNGDLESSSYHDYHDWDNGGYSIYSDRG